MSETTFQEPSKELEISKPHVTIVGASRRQIWHGEDVVGERLVGRALDHPNFPPNTGIYTSRIVRDIDENTVETLNTIYTLA